MGDCFEEIRKANGPGLKRRDVRPCDRCKRGLCEAGTIDVYRVRFTQFIVDRRAVQRAHGLEQVFNGHVGLAAAMGPDEDLLVPSHPERTLLLCQACALDSCVIGLLDTGATA